MIYISLIVAILCFKWADEHDMFTFGWYFNIFASALNFVIFLTYFTAV
jgi:Co/Zn/Cd efflux system component